MCIVCYEAIEPNESKRMKSKSETCADSLHSFLYFTGLICQQSYREMVKQMFLGALLRGFAGSTGKSFVFLCTYF